MNSSYSRNKNAQIASKFFLQKCKNIYKKKVPLPFNINDIADAETIDFSNVININNISSSKSAKITAKKIVNKYKKLRKNKSPLPFNINDIDDAETVDYNSDTNMNNVSSSKSAQIAAKKVVKKYKNLRRKRKSTAGIEDEYVF